MRKLCIFAIFLTLQIILTRPVSYLRKSDNQRTQNWDDIYISYWHESNLIGKCKTQTSRIIVVIVFKRSDFKKSKGFLRGFASQVPILCNRIKLTVSNSNVSPSQEEKNIIASKHDRTAVLYYLQGTIRAKKSCWTSHINIWNVHTILCPATLTLSE